MQIGLEEGLVVKHMASRAGGKVVINHLANNPKSRGEGYRQEQLMATQTGTASSYLDLLAQFHTFVTGLSGGMAWTALRTAAPEYIWSAPGSLGSPADPLIIGAKPFSNVPADYYNWRLGGFPVL